MVFFSCCVVVVGVRTRVGMEGREKRERKRRRKTERQHHTRCLLFRVTAAGAVKAVEIFKSEGGGQFLIKHCGICHTQTITTDSPSFVLLNCWPMSLRAETLAVFPLTSTH